MWNMCLTDVISKTGNTGNKFSFPVTTSNSVPSSQSVGTQGSWDSKSTKLKPNYCWKFNKGKCKFGTNCKFINRCSYCDSPAHGINTCPTKT